MAKQTAYKTARQALLPVLVDNTRETSRLSAKLFSRFGVVSLIFGRPRLRDLFAPSSQTLRLPYDGSERLRVEALIDLAKQSHGHLLVLIPCSAVADEWIARHAKALEPYFLLSNPEAIFSLPLLTEDTPDLI